MHKTPNLSSLIQEIINIISPSYLHLSAYKSQLEKLKNRLNEGQFHLAVLGQFKRGKSTLLNALLGMNILPTSVIPLTAIPTFIYFSENLSIKIIFQNKRFTEVNDDFDKIKETIIRYVSEEQNPKNQYKVSYVELFMPAQILKNGFVFIDTPGIGSTHKHNTEMTLNFLPQCDACLFVTSADPPITEVEINFLKRVKDKVSKIFFILNKIDYLDKEELETSLTFLKNVLSTQVKIEVSEKEIYPISAKLGLKAKKNNNSELMNICNLKKLEIALVDFMLKEKNEILNKAISKKTFDILDNITTRVKILINSYNMPLDELETKIRILSEKIKEVQEEKLYLNDMLKGDKKRIEKFLDEETETLRLKSTEYFNEIILNILENSNLDEIKEKIQKTLEQEIPPYFEKEFGVFTNKFNEHTSKMLGKYENKANELIESIKQHAMKLMNIPYIPQTSKEGLKMKIKPYWVVNRWETTLDFLTNVIVDSVLPKKILKNKLKKRFLEKLELLINSNIENLHWSIFQGIQDTFRQFSYEFENRINDVIENTKGAVEKAFELKKTETTKVKNQITELENLHKNLMAYKKLLEIF